MRTNWPLVIGGLILIILIAFLARPQSSGPNMELPTVSTETLKQTNEALRYSVSLEYPELSGMTRADVEAKINKEIRANVETLATAFAADAEEIPKDLRDQYPAGAESTLEMRYSVVHLDPHLFSVRFDNSIYTIGAAHPANFTTTLLYDLDRGEAVGLSRLFTLDPRYLETLSETSRALLKQKLGELSQESTIEAGTLPEPESFKSFLLSDEGLKLLFDPAQVAPYAAGIQEVLIPFRELSDKIDPRYNLDK